MRKGFRVGLALGGGGARGFAHIGAIRVLKSHSIPIDLIVGTSMGAIIGANFCLNPDVDALEKNSLAMLEHPQIKKLESLFSLTAEENHQKFIIQRLLSRIKNLYLWNLQTAKRWLVRTEPMVRLFKEVFNNWRFSDTKIPFACVAVDLNTASSVIIQEGRILEAVLASSSIPGIFAPLRRGNQLLTDGGILSSVPARQARILGADFVIGIDLTNSHSERKLLSGLDVMFQADWVKSSYLNKLNLRDCDWVITPEINNVSWVEFSQGLFCIRQGESAALRDIDKIKASLSKKKRFYFLKRHFFLKSSRKT